ncbi:unnamed protein product [Vitrella brassicaformis CCMP3155]|uniref:Uncharacterized protein n=1 Tax=Vitrella brassicaformis (strain CCMP3155) TaxID=1169540 RepID=A0A0G4GL05_VITBC|nr:unnamed protein product [Vitrella brassicaformis CCMP3155]|eukprot:CEM30703.1 unnamed protein product [Vitrella brassicaformis CCMP3155]
MPGCVRDALKMVVDTTEKYVKSEEDSDAGCLTAIFLPTMLLFPMNRGGRGGYRKWGARFKRFWAGEWQALLDESKNFPHQGRHVFAPHGDGPVEDVLEPSPEDQAASGRATCGAEGAVTCGKAADCR